MIFGFNCLEAMPLIFYNFSYLSPVLAPVGKSPLCNGSWRWGKLSLTDSINRRQHEILAHLKISHFSNIGPKFHSPNSYIYIDFTSASWFNFDPPFNMHLYTREATQTLLPSTPIFKCISNMHTFLK